MSPNTNRLADGSYDVNAPALPCPGTVLGPPYSSTDVLATCAVIVVGAAKRREVAVMMHSYGAVVGCEALKNIEIEKPSTYDTSFGVRGRRW